LTVEGHGEMWDGVKEDVKCFGLFREDAQVQENGAGELKGTAVYPGSRGWMAINLICVCVVYIAMQEDSRGFEAHEAGYGQLHHRSLSPVCSAAFCRLWKAEIQISVGNTERYCTVD